MPSAKAVLFTAPNKVEVRPIEVPDAGPGELLIESEATVISPGTEGRCLRGQQPNSLPFPFIPGYSIAGRVIQAPGRSKIKVGDRVMCSGTRRASVGIQWGGQVSHAVVPASSVVPVPERVEPGLGALAKTLGIAMRGVRVAQARPGQSVAVIGLGLIGSLSARLHHHFGANLLALDVSPKRVATAIAAGLKAVVPKGSVEDAVRSYFPDGADIVVDATGSPAVLPHAVLAALTKPWGPRPTPSSKLIVQGSYPADVCVPYQDAFQREISILFPRDTTMTDMIASMNLIASGEPKFDDIVSTRVPPEEAPEIYRRLAAQEDLLTAVIEWK